MYSSSPVRDLRFFRALLPRVSRTFALNIRVLSGELGDSVCIAYLLCRAADALEDSWPGSPVAVRDRFDRFLAALAGESAAAAALAVEASALAEGGTDLELVAELPHLLHVFESLPATHREPVVEGVRILAGGMSRYATRAAARPDGVPYLDQEAELDDYCFVVAGCVGQMLTRLFGAVHGVSDPETGRRRLALAPEVGRALQLTNILLDWPVDMRRGRCHVPASWLDEHRLTPRDLIRGDRPEVRAVAQRLERKARAALARVPDYLDLIPVRRVRYRLFCLLPAVWAQRSLRHARRDPEFPWGPRRPRLPRGELLRASLATFASVHHGRALRRLYALDAAPVAGH